MKTTTASELRRNLARTLDTVTTDHEPVVITREGGKPAAVLMSFEDFGVYKATHYLLRSPANADRLLAGVAELEAGRGTERAIDD